MKTLLNIVKHTLTFLIIVLSVMCVFREQPHAEFLTLLVMLFVRMFWDEFEKGL